MRVRSTWIDLSSLETIKSTRFLIRKKKIKNRVMPLSALKEFEYYCVASKANSSDYDQTKATLVTNSQQ